MEAEGLLPRDNLRVFGLIELNPPSKVTKYFKVHNNIYKVFTLQNQD